MRSYNFDNHPNFAGRLPDLDPNQKGLLKITKSYSERKECGDKFENDILETIRSSFPEVRVLNNIYFESGIYNNKLHLYESIQIDVLLICEEGVFCIEAKWIGGDKYAKVSGGAVANKWQLQKFKGSTVTETNGVKQNYGHYTYLTQLFEYLGIDVPVYRITVIGGIERSRILAQEYMDDNLVDYSELLERIKYIRGRYKGGMNTSVDSIEKIISEWSCKEDGIEKQHIVYVRHLRDKKLPARCKGILRVN